MKPEDFLLVQPQQDRALAKFRKMVESGVAILAQAGFSGLTSEAIVARAGVNISTFYKYFRNREAFVSFLAINFIDQQTSTLRGVINAMPPDAPLDMVLPAMIDGAVEDWSRNPASLVLQGSLILDPVLYAAYSRSSLDVAEALRHYMDIWHFKGTYADWQRMHSVFGDCAIVLFDRAAKADPEEQALVIRELKNLAIAYFRTAVRDTD